ncbi:T9SS type A sorting domain-containing protein [Niastella caeni]|uniref:T9SS type A sorting domain-containing protein n=1 Tax=Niastella caeni TaxID=2569763 RepID=A0A4S8I367_9BACT|nr:T9SS type A sorting domain-containing protein [Niastella caeni]THU40492.1 T9SS type A sorting domain-containing protein [Niastella caeni]
MIPFMKFLSATNCPLYRFSSSGCLSLTCLIAFTGGLKAQPFLGTNSFATASTVTLAATGACTSDRTVTYLGFQFTLRSGVNCAMNNATGSGSDGHINFITTPLTTGIWQEARIGSSDGSEFRLNNFQFAVLTTPFVGKTITVTGYRNGSMVSGATAVSSAITATGLTNTVTVDVSANAAFSNVDEIRLVPSGSDAQGTLSILLMTLAAPSTLPLHFVKVQAAATSTGVAVQFFTAEESNVKEYEIQVSANGSDYTTQAIVPAKNGANNSYRAVINSLPGKNYIRIQSTDIDGSKNYSFVMLVGSKQNLEMEVFPNPTKRTVFITGAYNLPFVLFDLQGRIIRSGRVTDGSLDVADLHAGMYLLQINGKSFKLQKE